MIQQASLTYGHATHIGLRRAENQDAHGKFPQAHLDLTGPGGQLFVVADGMGGHQGGREASRMAVQLLADVFFSDASDNVPGRLQRAFAAANRQIYQRGTCEPELFGMGTTCTALALRGDQGWIGHVGDSRAYRIHRTGIEQLTHDHTRVAEMVRRHLLTRDEAARHPHRHLLSRALGVRPTVEVDLFALPPLQPGDHFLLCSDGLSRVTDQELHALLLAYPPQAACDRLVQTANERGGQDNITVQVIAYHPHPVPG